MGDCEKGLVLWLVWGLQATINVPKSLGLLEKLCVTLLKQARCCQGSLLLLLMSAVRAVSACMRGSCAWRGWGWGAGSPTRSTYRCSPFGLRPVCIRSGSCTGKTQSGSGTCARTRRCVRSTHPRLENKGVAACLQSSEQAARSQLTPNVKGGYQVSREPQASEYRALSFSSLLWLVVWSKWVTLVFTCGVLLESFPKEKTH